MAQQQRESKDTWRGKVRGMTPDEMSAPLAPPSSPNSS